MRINVTHRIRQPRFTREEIEALVWMLYPAGKVKGVLGGWIVRWQNEKPVFVPRPEWIKSSNTQASVMNRKSMAAATKFAVFLNNIPIIKQAWSLSPLPGNCAYRKIIGFNRKRMLNNAPSLLCSITPDNADLESKNHISFDGISRITLCGSLSTEDIPAAVLVLIDPVQKSSPDFELIDVSACISAGNCEAELDASHLARVQNYKKFLLFYAFFRVSGNTISWTPTGICSGKLFLLKGKPAELPQLFFLCIPVPQILNSHPAELKDHPPPGPAFAHNYLYR